MSYTFSRRDFMKYSAVAAVAVAGSSMFTGCSLISNPNRPTGTIGSTLKPGSKICDATLLGDTSKPVYNAADKSLTCKFKIYTRVGQLQVTGQHFQLNVTDADGKVIPYYTGVSGLTINVDKGSAAGLEQYKTVEPIVTFTGITDLTTAKSISVIYIPKIYAGGSISDSYSDIYATWTFEPKAIGLGAAAEEGN